MVGTVSKYSWQGSTVHTYVCGRKDWGNIKILYRFMNEETANLSRSVGADSIFKLRLLFIILRSTGLYVPYPFMDDL